MLVLDDHERKRIDKEFADLMHDPVVMGMDIDSDLRVRVLSDNLSHETKQVLIDLLLLYKESNSLLPHQIN